MQMKLLCQVPGCICVCCAGLVVGRMEGGCVAWEVVLFEGGASARTACLLYTSDAADDREV